MNTRHCPIFAALALGLAMLAMPRPVAAATAECIPASRYTTLAQITDGDIQRLGALLGYTGAPPADACRAVLLAGPIDKGSAATLLTAIERNKGWLAEVYIDVGDGDLTEEVELARLMREFALSGLVMESSTDYRPDFLVKAPALPASVSDSWPATDLDSQTPLTLALRDYLDNTSRQISIGPNLCGAGCWTILAGAVERHTRRLRGRAGDLPPDPPGSEQSADVLRTRDGIRLRFGPKPTLVKIPRGYRPQPNFATFSNFDRAPIAAACKSEIEYVSAMRDEIVKQTDTFAVKAYPYMRLGPILPKFRRFQQATINADLCTRKAFNQIRVKAYETHCEKDCSTILAHTADSAQAMLKALGVTTEIDTTLKVAIELAPVPDQTPSAAAPPPPAETAADLVKRNAVALFRSPHQSMIGNRDGGITLVEFFDYNCGPCRRSAGETLDMVANHPELKVVLKEMGLLGPRSVEAARVAAAVRMQDTDGSRSRAFYEKLFAVPGSHGKAEAVAVARAIGLDMARLDRDMASPEVDATLAENAQLAKDMHIGGTPSFILGDQVVFGRKRFGDLKTKIEAMVQ